MTGQLEIIGETGLQFFGKMSASISHEIKNVLAIINENAGLLEDFTLMADRGMPIDPARLKTLAATVLKQVNRADEIINNMNRFARSIDETVTTVDLNEIIELLIVLTDRFAAMRCVSIETKLSENPIKIRTSPFFLMNLLWLCLDFAMAASGTGKCVELVTEKTENGARIRFIRLKGLTEKPVEVFTSEREKSLLGLLEADLTANPKGEEILLNLPENIDN